MEHKELHRLISAAIVNQRFRCHLLENPLEAVRAGYLGQTFSLTSQECELLASIAASDFTTFSQYIHQWVSGNGHQGETGQSASEEKPEGGSHQEHRTLAAS
jgi:hypothetical protein